VAKLDVQVISCASKVLHVEAQCVQRGMGVLSFAFFRLQQLLVLFLLSGQPTL
jgi:hypothetical protein